MPRPKGDTNYQYSDSLRMPWPFELSCSDIFIACFAILALAVHRFRFAEIWHIKSAQASAFIFDSIMDVLLKQSKFWHWRCLDSRGIRNHNLGIHAELFELSGPAVLYLMFVKTGCGGKAFFVCKANGWKVNCALAADFIFDFRMDVLVKRSKFLRLKMSRLAGDSKPHPC